MTKSTGVGNISGKSQPLGPVAVQILTLLADRGPMTMRELRDAMPDTGSMLIGATLKNFAGKDWIESDYLGQKGFGCGKIYSHRITDLGRYRLSVQAELMRRHRKAREKTLFTPNARKLIGDLGGIKTPSIWAYAAQVGA